MEYQRMVQLVRLVLQAMVEVEVEALEERSN